MADTIKDVVSTAKMSHICQHYTTAQIYTLEGQNHYLAV